MRIFNLIFLLFYMFLVKCDELNQVEEGCSPLQVHYIPTKDEYNLTMFQMPRENAKSILLLHSLAFSSDDWLFLKNDSLACLLYGKGYNIWIANFRGNYYSEKNEMKKNHHWDFTFDEMGKYDLTAMLDFIKQNSNDVVIVSHGLGAALTMIMNSENPEYVDLVNKSVWLAPVFYVKNITSVKTKLEAKYLAPPIQNSQRLLLRSERHWNAVPRGGPYHNLLKLLCSFSWLKNLCLSQITLTYGKSEHIDQKTFKSIIKTYPSGTSSKPFFHLTQLYNQKNNNSFRKYDYGEKKNKQIYSSSIPPEYDPTKTTYSVLVISGGNDASADPDDVKKLVEILPNTEHKIIPNYNHVDFLWVYDKDLFDYINSWIESSN